MGVDSVGPRRVRGRISTNERETVRRGVGDSVVRPARDEDAAAIAEIYNDAIAHSTATFDTAPRSVEDQRRRLARRDGAHPVLVAASRGEVLGWAALVPWSDRPAYAATAEVSVYVRAARRGRGLGRALLRRLLAEGRAGGLHAVIARVADGNAASLRLFEGAGFRRVGTMREVGRKFGRLLDVHLLERLYGDDSP